MTKARAPDRLTARSYAHGEGRAGKSCAAADSVAPSPPSRHLLRRSAARVRPRRAFAVLAALLVAVAVGLALASGGGALGTAGRRRRRRPDGARRRRRPRVGRRAADRRADRARRGERDADRRARCAPAARRRGSRSARRASGWPTRPPAPSSRCSSARRARSRRCSRAPTPTTSRSRAARVWIASSADGRVYVRRARAARPRGRCRPGRAPVALAADARRVVAVDDRSGTLTVFDARTRGAGRLAGAASAARRSTSRSRATPRGSPTPPAAGSSPSTSPPGAIERTRRRRPPPGRDRRRGRGRLRAHRRRTGAGPRRSGPARAASVDAEPAALAVDAEHVWVASPSSDEVLRFER